MLIQYDMFPTGDVLCSVYQKIGLRDMIIQLRTITRNVVAMLQVSLGVPQKLAVHKPCPDLKWLTLAAFLLRSPAKRRLGVYPKSSAQRERCFPGKSFYK